MGDPLADEESFYRHLWGDTHLGPPADWPNELRLWVRFMLTSVHPVLLAWGPECSLLFNRAYSRLLGDGWRDVLGASAPVIWSPIWHEIAWVFDDVLAGKSGKMEDQPILSFASGFTEQRWFDRSYSPIKDAHGRVLGGVLLTTEHTATVVEKLRLATELEVLRGLLENVTSLVLVTEGADHQITYANAAFRQFVGGRSCVGLRIGRAFPEAVEQGLMGILDRVFRTGLPLSLSEASITLRHAETGAEQVRYVTAIYQPLIDSNGKVTGVFGEGHDVTDHVAARKALDDLHAERIHISRVNAMGTMAATLAHELNQPLAAASSYLSGTQRTLGSDIDPLTAQGIRGAIGSLLRAGDIIRSLRSMTSKSGLKREPFELGLAAQEAVKLVRVGGFQEANVTIETSGELVVMGDHVQIEQVLVNLVKNAVEAVAQSPTKQVRILLSEVKGEAQISVEDTGPGVSPEMAASVFESFATGKEAGMGVGLSICRTIIEAHGGRIWLDETLAGGASFCFTLPIAEKP